jgi:sarcosine oxidase subunit beta
MQHTRKRTALLGRRQGRINCSPTKPVAGAMMAELITACEQGRDHDRDPLDFHLPRAKRTISVGFFSRRREVNPESSFSVLG